MKQTNKIAILRGINVGGKRKILMADLKAMMEQLSCNNIRTYIQSGNVIFDSEESTKNLEVTIKNSISNTFGFDVPVIVLTAQELENAVSQNPFYTKDADIKKLYLAFLQEKSKQEKELSKIDASPDKFVLQNKCVYIYYEGKSYASKLSNNFLEKKLSTTASTRNWRTVLKLMELSRE